MRPVSHFAQQARGRRQLFDETQAQQRHIFRIDHGVADRAHTRREGVDGQAQAGVGAVRVHGKEFDIGIPGLGLVAHQEAISACTCCLHIGIAVQIGATGQQALLGRAGQGREFAALWRKRLHVEKGAATGQDRAARLVGRKALQTPQAARRPLGTHHAHGQATLRRQSPWPQHGGHIGGVDSRIHAAHAQQWPTPREHLAAQTQFEWCVSACIDLPVHEDFM